MSERIRHLPDQHRWEAVHGDGDQARVTGFLSYQLRDGVLDLQHTVVDPSMRGQGLGGRLVEAGMQHAREEGLRVRPTCPFIPSYLQEHPEHQDLLEDVVQVEQVPIRDESIRLGQLLKLASLVPDGAMARAVIENSEVTVDGQVVARRGTQVRPGQVVEYAGQRVSPVSEA